MKANETKSDYEKHIEHMLSDDWEGDEEIFVPEDECSKSFNIPKILGCTDNLDNNIVDGPFMEKKI
jgi:hypothetical protein